MPVQVFMVVAAKAVPVVEVAAAWVARSWVGLRHFQRHDGQDLGAVAGIGHNLTQIRGLGEGFPGLVGESLGRVVV